jgi:hypothetical protein
MINSTKVQVVIGLVICGIIAVTYFGSSENDDDKIPGTTVNDIDKSVSERLPEPKFSMEDVLRDQQEIVKNLAIANKELEFMQETEAKLMEEYVALGGAIESGTAIGAGKNGVNKGTKARLKEITTILEQNRQNAEVIRQRIETTEQKLDQLFNKLK